MALRCLKCAQLLLAIAVFGSACVLFFPSVDVLFFIPLCSLYVFWAIRAMNNRRPSMWLAGLTSLMVAVLLGALVAIFEIPLLQTTATNLVWQSSVVVTAEGRVIDLESLPVEARLALRRQNQSVGRGPGASGIVSLILTFFAWGVVVLHAFQWRWLTHRT